LFFEPKVYKLAINNMQQLCCCIYL